MFIFCASVSSSLIESYQLHRILMRTLELIIHSSKNRLDRKHLICTKLSVWVVPESTAAMLWELASNDNSPTPPRYTKPGRSRSFNMYALPSFLEESGWVFDSRPLSMVAVSISIDIGASISTRAVVYISGCRYSLDILWLVSLWPEEEKASYTDPPKWRWSKEKKSWI